jgi:hypothetical protein
VNPRARLDDTEKRKFLTPPGLELQPPRTSSQLPVAILTALSRHPASVWSVYLSWAREETAHMFCIQFSCTYIVMVQIIRYNSNVLSSYFIKHNRSGMVAVLGPVEALPCYIHTYKLLYL